jgi:hypothetical protein
MNGTARTLRGIFRGFFRSLRNFARLFDLGSWCGGGCFYLWQLRRHSPQRRLRLLLESLEDRVTPSVPIVGSVSPSSGDAAGSTAVAIYGWNFTGATAVTFGSTAASYSVVSGSEIDATAPSGSAGTVDVTVTNADGTSSTGSGDHFTYYVLPAVTGVSPSHGATTAGATVTITGTNLDTATAVYFGTTWSGSFTINSSTQITTTAPSVMSSATVDVTVASANGTSATSSADEFTYTHLAWTGPTATWSQSPTPPPVVTNPGSQSNDEADSVSLGISATDPSGYTLAYAAVNLPAGLSWTRR